MHLPIFRVILNVIILTDTSSIIHTTYYNNITKCAEIDCRYITRFKIGLFHDNKNLIITIPMPFLNSQVLADTRTGAAIAQTFI